MCVFYIFVSIVWATIPQAEGTEVKALDCDGVAAVVRYSSLSIFLPLSSSSSSSPSDVVEEINTVSPLHNICRSPLHQADILIMRACRARRQLQTRAVWMRVPSTANVWAAGASLSKTSPITNGERGLDLLHRSPLRHDVHLVAVSTSSNALCHSASKTTQSCTSLDTGSFKLKVKICSGS